MSHFLKSRLSLIIILISLFILPLPVIAINTGNVTISVTPSTVDQVQIYVDSILMGNFPAKSTLELQEGTHEIRIENSLYNPWKTRVFVRKGKTVTLAVKLTPNSGKLEINSVPAGADIMVDGTPQGVTPLSISSISKGYHTVFLQNTGYFDWSGNKVYVKPGDTTRLNIKLNSYPVVQNVTPFPTPSPTQTPQTGSLIIKADQQGYSIDIRSNFYDPTRDPLLDGKWHENVGSTPAYWNNLVPPGSYTIRLKDSSGNIVWCGNTVVIADQTTEINAAIGMLCPICTC